MYCITQNITKTVVYCSNKYDTDPAFSTKLHISSLVGYISIHIQICDWSFNLHRNLASLSSVYSDSPLFTVTIDLRSWIEADRDEILPGTHTLQIYQSPKPKTNNSWLNSESYVRSRAKQNCYVACIKLWTKYSMVVWNSDLFITRS